MRGEITKEILHLLAKSAVFTADLFTFFLKIKYGASQFELERVWHETFTHYDKMPKPQQRKMRHDYLNLLNKLKREGFIKEQSSSNSKTLAITAKGKKKLAALIKLLTGKESLPAVTYPSESISKNIIVIFDIPEKQRRKRHWLRQALRFLEFSMIQKSVWMGKIKLPEKFLKDLKQLNLIDYVEIFEITKSGTLKSLV